MIGAGTSFLVPEQCLFDFFLSFGGLQHKRSSCFASSRGASVGNIAVLCAAQKLSLLCHNLRGSGNTTEKQLIMTNHDG